MYKEYIDFKFGDKWASEFNLVAVTASDRYSPPVYGNINSNTSTVAGKRGVYKWKTQFGEKIFSINIAYDNLSVRDISKIKAWLNPAKLQKLVFSDEPHMFYYACLNTDPKFDFVPFIEGASTVGTKHLINGVYKGEMTLEFNAIDGVGYSDYGTYENVEIEPGLEYSNSEYVNMIMPWVQYSNLINNDSRYNDMKIYTSSFFDQDTGETNTCGLAADHAHRFYLLNSGDTEAKLNLSFDFIMPGEQPLVIYTQRVKKIGQGTGWQPLGIISAIVIESFKDYIPFIEFVGEENYNKLIGTDTNAKKEVMNKYIIEIDSELREVYIKEKANTDNVLNINKFNGNRDFLKLCECNFVDYSKPFPTLEEEGNGVLDPSKIVFTGTALENTYFNEVFLGQTDVNYRLVNVHFNWKHTYN